MGLQFYLIISAVLFVLGMISMLTRRNAVAVLMGIELILNSANINFVAFSRFSAGGEIEGQMMGIFIIILAAAEAAVAMAIVLNLYRRHRNIDIDNMRELQG
jgi:NADH:ubiquinone oxidoreductase subunit K